MRAPTPFNPLDRRNLAASAAEALLEGDPEPLGSLEPFIGSGVYAIYYVGEFPAYKAISSANADGKWVAPIYVGKAIPSGGRKGGMDLDAPARPYLKRRLDEHAESIRTANTTLRIDDFWARYLVVDDIWIPLVESLMISRFAPVWNVLLDGFGNHDPGSGRYNGLAPRWDVLHPGRGWAKKCRARPETAAVIASEVEAMLAARPVAVADRLFRRT